MRYRRPILTALCGILPTVMAHEVARADIQRTLVALTGDYAAEFDRLDTFGRARLNQQGEVVYRATQVSTTGSNVNCQTALPIGLGVTTFVLPSTAGPVTNCNSPQLSWFSCYVPQSGSYRIRSVWTDFQSFVYGHRVGQCTPGATCTDTFMLNAGSTVYIVVGTSNSSPLLRRGAFRIDRTFAGALTHQPLTPETDGLFHFSNGILTSFLRERTPAFFDDSLLTLGMDTFSFAGNDGIATMVPESSPPYIRARTALVGWNLTREDFLSFQAIDEVPIDSTWTPDIPGDASVCEAGQFAWVDADGLILYYGENAIFSGTPVPNVPGVSYGRLEQPSQSRSGNVVFKARLTGDQIVLDQNDAAILRVVDEVPQITLTSGDPLPAAGHNITIRTFAAEPAINNDGAIVVAATLAGKGVVPENDVAILTSRSGPVTVAAREGESAWGLGEDILFETVSKYPTLNNAGDIAFVGSLVSDAIVVTNNTGIWMSHGSGRKRLVVREGESVHPDAPNRFFASFSKPTLNGRGDIAFVATLRGPDITQSNNRALFIAAANGRVFEIARTEDVVELNPGDLRTIEAIGFGPGRESDGGGQFNDSGTVLYQVWFTDRTEALFTATAGCRADFDGSGVIAVPDIFAYLSAWFAQDSAAEWDGIGGIAVPDIFAFLSAWFAAAGPC